MNLEKASKLMMKISNLIKYAEEEKGISALEKDLLLSYVRDLYEVLIESGSNIGNGLDEHKTAIPEKLSEPPIQHQEDLTTDESSMLSTENREEGVSRRQDESPEENSSNADEISPGVLVEESSLVSGDKIDALFELKEVKELSEKLSASPIKDIKAAMGINQRIGTISELFGGRQDVFDTTLKDLYSFFSYDQAKAYLKSGAASRFNWSEDLKIEKAREFIKLVSRLYTK